METMPSSTARHVGSEAGHDACASAPAAMHASRDARPTTLEHCDCARASALERAAASAWDGLWVGGCVGVTTTVAPAVGVTVGRLAVAVLVGDWVGD